MALLKVENLRKYYYSGLFKKEVHRAVDGGVSFEVEKGGKPSVLSEEAAVENPHLEERF